MSVDIDVSASLHKTTVFAGDASVGHCSKVGLGASSGEPVRIGKGVKIGAFCLIEGDVELGDGVEIDHYCRISWGVKIGANSRVLYGAQIYDEAVIGKNCIVSGEIVDRAVIGDNVTFQGEMAHTHADATGFWDETVEPSPKILNGSVVGVRALIIGGISVGPRAYIAAGERVTCDVQREMVVCNGKSKPLADCRGMFKVREE